MKRFDKGYIYSSLLSDLFGSLVIVFIFLKDFFLNEELNKEDAAAATPIFLIAFAVIYLIFIIYRVLYFKTSGYEFSEKEIKCNRGVLFRKRSVLEYKKVHAINKKQNIAHRIFGVAVLTVDSGSTNTSHQAEITIVEKEKIVDDLIRKLNAIKENGAEGIENTLEKEEILLSDQDSLYRFTSKRKMLYTLINIASTAFFTVVLGLLAIIVISFGRLLLLNSSESWGQYLLIALLITIGASLLFSVFSFIGSMIYSFVGYHKFTISGCQGSIQISYGLFEKHTNSFRYDRIKAVKISQSLVQRMLGFASIRLEVIGYTTDSGNDNVEQGVLVPFCKMSEVGEILKKVLPDYVPEKKETKAASFFPFVSWFFLFFGIVTSIILFMTISVMLIFHAPFSAISVTVLSILMAGMVFVLIKLFSAAFSFQINGLAIANGKITVYSGAFTKMITVFKAENLIAVEDVTTPLRKKRGITSLVLHLKTNAFSNEVKVHIQKDTLTENLEKLLIL